MHRARWLSAVGALLVACQPHETPHQVQTRMEKESEAFTAAVSPIAKRYAGWAAAGQADSIASIFTEQGREMPPDGPAVAGRAAVKTFEARKAATVVSKIVIRGESYMANGPLGVERGRYSFEGRAKPGAPKGIPLMVREDGKYLIHWHNVNGRWQMVELIWNSNRRRMMPARASANKKPVAHTTGKATPKKNTKKKT